MLKHAYEIPGLQFSVPAGGAVPRRRFVTINANGAGVLATATSPVVGVSRDDAKEGEALDLADGIVMVETSAVVASGATVASTADGKAVTATEDATVVGIALVGAASGSVASIKLT